MDSAYRFRTETFDRGGVTDPASVIEFEIFELLNTDIPEYLSNTILKGDPISKELTRIVNLIESDEYDEIDEIDTLDFCHNIVSCIEQRTGLPLKYVLWLADLPAVIDKNCYGQLVDNAHDIDTYEIGHVVLSDLGYEGTLYGYSYEPLSLEDTVTIIGGDKSKIENALKNEQDSSTSTKKRLSHLYTKVNNKLETIQEIIIEKEQKASVLLNNR